MKKITCRTLGGPCDAEMTASTQDEMMTKGMKHVKAAHPEMVKAIESMPEADMKKWRSKFDAAWQAAPEVK